MVVRVDFVFKITDIDNYIKVYRGSFVMRKITSLVLVAFFVLGSGLSACSTAGDASSVGLANEGIYDPFEETNRAVFKFNTAVDHAVINPAIRGYRTVTPQPARTGLRNLLRHIKSPMILANQLLQGDLEGSKDVVLRATINTFVGGFGLFDVAGHEGIAYEPEDFGQTLAVWGVDHGPFLVLPFFGVSSTRDYAGTVVEIVADPVNHYLRNTDRDGLGYVNFGLSYLNLRDSLYDVLTDLEGSSIDYYATVRSAYYQSRKALVADIGENGSMSAASDFDEFY